MDEKSENSENENKLGTETSMVSQRLGEDEPEGIHESDKISQRSSIHSKSMRSGRRSRPSRGSTSNRSSMFSDVECKQIYRCRLTI